MWRLEWTARALADVERLGARIRKRIFQTMERFAQTGHGDIRRVQESEGELAVRVGKWRVFFVQMEAERVIRVRRVRSRGSAYQK